MRNRTELDILLRWLLAERDLVVPIPDALASKRSLLRALMNTRLPGSVPNEIIDLQNRELQRQLQEKGIVRSRSLAGWPNFPEVKLWQGDITRLEVDAIVNAANSRLLGCFVPGHNCVDNAIHSAAGMQLRESCNELMNRQGHEEPPGGAKITSGFNLPSSWVIHTVGPIVTASGPGKEDAALLTSSYKSCLNLANEKRLSSIAFCCISTGLFGYPSREAATIAISTVFDFFKANPAASLREVIFNVFKNEDHVIYSEELKRQLETR